MADTSASGVLTVAWDGVTPATAPAGSVVGPLNIGRDTTVGVDVDGTFTATVTLEVSINGSKWFAANTTTTAGVASTNTFTAPGDKLVSTSGASLIRARCSAYTSGSATVVMAGTPGGGGGGSGGGGGGAVTIADGADVAQGTTTDVGIITDIAGTSIGFLRGLVKQSITLLARLPAALTGSGNLKAAIVETTVTQPVSGTVTITPSGTQTVSGTVTANAGTGTFAISAASLPLPATAATDRATAAAPGSVELSDGAAFYTAAKTGQLPTALVSARLDVNLGAAPASLTIGTPGAGPYPTTGFAPAAPTCTFTRPANTTAYTIGDEVGTAGTAPTTVSVARVNGGSGVIQGAQVFLSEYPAIVPQLVLLVFSATVTLAGDNAQLNLSDAHAKLRVTAIPLTASQSSQYSAGAPVTAGGIWLSGSPDRPAAHFVCGGSEQTLYCCLITLNAWTPSANSTTLDVYIDAELN